MNVQDILSKASREIGYYAPSDPEPGSKYGRWMANLTGEKWLAGPSTSVWWCAIFVSWVFDGVDTKGVLPSYNCDQIRTRARNKGMLLSNVRDAAPGDIVLFDWDNNGSLNHVGIVEKNFGSYVQTIEGNTSGSDWGSQSAGNGVHRRTRAWGPIKAVVRIFNNGNTSTYVNKNRIDEDGYWGSATTRRAQQLAGLVADGEVWHQYPNNRRVLPGCTSGWKFDYTEKGSPLIRWMQKNVFHITADGIAGKQFANAMIRRYGNGITDGVLSSPSVAIMGFQRALNNGRF